MTVDDQVISFAGLLTAAGAGVASGLVAALVELIKTVWGRDALPVSGAFLAFVLSAALYVLAGVATGVSTLDAGLGVSIAWLTCATSAVGVHSTITHVVGQRG
jgi:hypothetical protein